MLAPCACAAGVPLCSRLRRGVPMIRQPAQLGAAYRSHRQGLRVLVVDDYPDNTESMAMLLRLFGHEVATALGGSAALQAARASQPDVVLLDISMPGMTGYEVAKQLRCMFE